MICVTEQIQMDLDSYSETYRKKFFKQIVLVTAD